MICGSVFDMNGIACCTCRHGRKVIRRKYTESERTTVGEVIGGFAARYPTLAPQFGTSYALVTLYRNDEDVRFRGGFDALVQDGDDHHRTGNSREMT